MLVLVHVEVPILQLVQRNPRVFRNEPAHEVSLCHLVLEVGNVPCLRPLVCPVEGERSLSSGCTSGYHNEISRPQTSSGKVWRCDVIIVTLQDLLEEVVNHVLRSLGLRELAPHDVHYRTHDPADCTLCLLLSLVAYVHDVQPSSYDVALD